jgi:hypothetical protein
MGVTGLKLFIDGQPKTEPLEWKGLKLTAAFGDNSNQPEIESERFTLVRDAAQVLIDRVKNGDIFEGPDAVLEYRERDNKVTVFDGFIDTSEDYEEISPMFGSAELPIEVRAKFRGKTTVTNFLDQISGVTYGFLYDEGAIKDSDFSTIKTAIVKKASFLDVAISLIAIYLLSKQIEDTKEKLKKSVQEVIAFFGAGGVNITPGLIYAAALAVIQAAYAVGLLVILIKLVKDLIDLLVPPIVKNKGIKFRTLLSKACERYGYTLVSPITELDDFYYLPSKPFSNSENILNGLLPVNVPTKIGIPSSGDFGYLITEAFEICKRMFLAKVDVIGNEVHLRNEEDPYWLNTSTYVPPININFPTKKYNTSDLNQTRLFTFLTDVSDAWTIENYTGTSYEVKTEIANPVNPRNGVIKGLDRTDIPLALPNSKTKLTPVEAIMIELAGVADALATLIGQRSNLKSSIRRNRINVLKVSQNEYSIAKVVYLKNGNIPSNHRSVLSAKALVEKYHGSKSFVTGDKLGQKITYENVPLPFTLSDYQKTIKNGIFILPDGRKARFIEIPYEMSSDTTECTFEVQEVYTNKLIEKTYEP